MQSTVNGRGPAREARRGVSGVFAALLAAGGLASGACTDVPPDIDADAMPSLFDTQAVVPSSALPDEVVPNTSNNNLDVVRFRGRVFFAFRTAASHFAGADTVLWALSRDDADGTPWRVEGRFAMGTDLREPRFLTWGGRLFLYFAVLGKDPLAFEPMGMRASAWREGAGFGEAVPSGPPTFIPWRAREVNGVPYLVGYTGGENIYNGAASEGAAVANIAVYLLTTDDGLTWRAAAGGGGAGMSGGTADGLGAAVTPEDRAAGIVLRGGNSETDFALLDDGALVAISRNEEGDALGFGSKVCRAEPGALGVWRCASDKRKYDSPLVFRAGPSVWLVARRNVSETGDFDLGRDDLSPADRYQTYQADYWQKPKRCALWRVDPATLTVSFAVDLPSRGDTCFPSALWHDAGTVDIYNYSSPPDGPDLTWIEGQTHPTQILRTRIRFQ